MYVLCMLSVSLNFELNQTNGDDAMKQQKRQNTNETKSIIWGLYGERLVGGQQQLMSTLQSRGSSAVLRQVSQYAPPRSRSRRRAIRIQFSFLSRGLAVRVCRSRSQLVTFSDLWTCCVRFHVNNLLRSSCFVRRLPFESLQE